MNRQKFTMLLQREVWEHRAPLIWTPAIISALFIFLTVFAVLMASNHLGEWQSEGFAIDVDKGRVSVDELVNALRHETGSEQRQAVITVWLSAIKVPFDLLLLFLLPFYCVAALFDERKDRSIYFWRSLPVSDVESVLAKVFTVVLIYPATMLLAAIAVQVVTLLIASVVALYFGLSTWSLIWQPSHYLSFVANGYLDYVMLMLWSLPFIGVLMLAGSATRRPYVWAVLPWPFLMLVEKWLFGTHELARWVGERVQGSFAILYNDLAHIGGGQGLRIHHSTTMFANVGDVLRSGQFWFGLVLGVALLWATVRTRRYLQDV